MRIRIGPAACARMAAFMLLLALPMVCGGADTGGYWEGKGKASEIPMKDRFRQLTRGADFEFWFNVDETGNATGEIELNYQSELTVENLPSVSAGGVSFNPKVGGKITDLNPKRKFKLAGSLKDGELTLEIATPEEERRPIEFTIRADPGVSAGFGGLTMPGGAAGVSGGNVYVFPMKPFSPFNGAANVQKRPGGPYAASFDARGSNWAIEWTARQVGAGREIRMSSNNSDPPGARKLANGQLNQACNTCSEKYARDNKLPTDPDTNKGGPGVFNVNKDKNFAPHYVVRNDNGDITDQSILKNIADYNNRGNPPVPPELEQYRRYDTFTPELHEQLMQYYRRYAPPLVPGKR